MSKDVNVIELLAKGFAGESAEVEKKEAENKLSPTALLSQGYAEAHPEPKKATKAKTVEIAEGE